MAHIVSCMLDADGTLEGYIAKQQASTDSLASVNSSVSSLDEKKPYLWRMQHPEARKYQLFPREKQLPPVTAGKQLDPEKAFAAAMAQSGEKSDKPEKSSLRLRIKEHNLTRRRKVSVPELGPMTTVQEVAMDSPTIPGRPALHERSISSPVNTWRRHKLADSLPFGHDGIRENTETKRSNTMDPQKTNTSALAQPMSPKNLAPLVIPNQSGALPRLARQLSLTRLRSGSNTSEPNTRTVKADESPKTRTPFTPFTPASAYTTTPKSALTASTLATPISAPAEARESPRPWEKAANTTPVGTPLAGNVDVESTPRAEVDVPRSATAMSYRTYAEASLRSNPAMGHRRNQSDTGSIMERGRPRKRFDGTSLGVSLRRTGSKRSKSAERRAFETLPQGWKPSEAAKMMESDEVSYLQKQALGQAMRFEVLKKEQVESLSKELRHLDERTEYLRHTYTSLRAGRRNLHSRICQYLRSPRVAKFSYESMLKQEEALAELDASIDDWVSKLEQAENRRTRVRQKLLEHVAAAATLAVSSPDITGTSESLQKAMGIRAYDGSMEVTTPPRSPVKAESHACISSPSPSPQRVVARVPSVIPEVAAEEITAALNLDDKASESQACLARMESIRIYADSDVYALLADVETEFTKLSGVGRQSPELGKTEVSAVKRRELHRAHSHEVLSGTPISNLTDKTPPMSPPAPTPPMKDTSGGEGILLTSAVFQPTVSVT
ncbi:putative Up-regulated during septation-domain-containing protein [Seiridium cardinale]